MTGWRVRSTVMDDPACDHPHMTPEGEHVGNGDVWRCDFCDDTFTSDQLGRGAHLTRA